VRGATRRAWVKFAVTGWLHGSIRWQLEPEERGVWADLICLAGECSQNGMICDNDGRPYPRQYIANQLNIPQELLDRTVAKCRREGRLDDRDDILIVTNWAAYQSEYERQKKYRNADKHRSIFEAWNEQKVVLHKTLTDEMERAMETALRNYSADDVVLSIRNYGDIINNNGYYFKYKWTLKDFLKRGLEKFMDGEVARQNYAKSDGRRTPQSPQSIGGREMEVEG